MNIVTVQVRSRAALLGFNAVCHDCRWVGPHVGRYQTARDQGEMHAVATHDADLDFVPAQIIMQSGAFDRMCREYRA